MDVLSDALRTFRCSAALFCRVTARGPWGLQVPASSIVAFRAVWVGRCVVRLASRDEVLEPGDLLLLPHGSAHTLSDAPDRPTRPLGEALGALPPKDRTLDLGGSGAFHEVLCGGFEVDRTLWNPVTSSLPQVVRARGPVISAALEAAGAELASERVGRDAVLTRLAELLLIPALRALEPPSVSWLAALSEPALLEVLHAIHTDPARPWSLDELASRAAMSRSGFTERFRRVVGTSPAQVHRPLAYAGRSDASHGLGAYGAPGCRAGRVRL